MTSPFLCLLSLFLLSDAINLHSGSFTSHVEEMKNAIDSVELNVNKFLANGSDLAPISEIIKLFRRSEYDPKQYHVSSGYYCDLYLTGNPKNNNVSFGVNSQHSQVDSESPAVPTFIDSLTYVSGKKIANLDKIFDVNVNQTDVIVNTKWTVYNWPVAVTFPVEFTFFTGVPSGISNIFVKSHAYVEWSLPIAEN